MATAREEGNSLPQGHGTFAYPRRLLYRFTSTGGHVGLAKRYRDYARTQGLIVPFTEKLKRNLNLVRLFGAADVWGDASLAFARTAKGAGVDKMLIHGRSSPADMKAINALGYLTSEYDNYTDIQPLAAGKPADSSHDLLPDHAVLKADSQRMKAWLTYDKKTQYMKRCPSLWVPTARLVIPQVLREQPYLGRFIDVTTAEGLYECYDDKHPLTRVQKRECGEKLLAYVRSQGLVVGGEHGIWWGVPHLDYIEGMMSGNRFGWPAGHLIHPKNRQEKFSGPYGTDTWENYDRWSMGHRYRAPLWELVFHDCVVSTWYWGDSNDDHVPPSGSSVYDRKTKAINGATFRARFDDDGVLWDIGPRTGKPFVSRLIYSSGATGWTDEPGELEQFRVGNTGPIRTEILVRKKLRNNVTYRKRYVFYADRFEISGTVNQSGGVFSRAYYLRPGQYEDGGGCRARVDGHGDAEGVSGRTRKPEWYAVYTADWAEACIPLSEVSSITYWDSPGTWGGIGFNGSPASVRLSYVIHAGAKDARFAEEDRRRLSLPVRVLSR